MRLTMYSGCTRGDAIDVDDKDLLDLTESKQKEVAIEVFTKLLETNEVYHMLKDLIQYYNTETINRGMCEQCFDNAYDYILDI